MKLWREWCSRQSIPVISEHVLPADGPGVVGQSTESAPGLFVSIGDDVVDCDFMPLEIAMFGGER